MNAIDKRKNKIAGIVITILKIIKEASLDETDCRIVFEALARTEKEEFRDYKDIHNFMDSCVI